MNSASNDACEESPVRGVVSGRDRWIALILGLIGIVLAVMTRQDVAHAVDQNNYLGGAQSLAQGRGYREAFVIGEPRCAIYPPLFPAYMAVGWRLGGGWPRSLDGIAVGQWLLAGLTGALTYLLLRQQGVGGRWAVPSTLLFLSSNCWHIMVNGLFSESLMQPLILGLLVLLGRAGPRGAAFYWGIGVLLAATYLTRSASTAIVGGAVLVVLWHARRLGLARVLAVFLPVVVAVVGWKLWTMGGTKTYASTFVEVVRDAMGPAGYALHVGNNLLSIATGRDVIGALCPFWARARYFPAVTALGLAGVMQVALAAIGMIGMVAVAWGLKRRWGQGDKWVAGIAGLYLLQNTLWWYWLGDRGMLVLVPLLWIWGHAGTQAIGERFRLTPVLRAIAAAALVGGIAINGALAVRISMGQRLAADRLDIEEAARWVWEHAGTNDVIAATSDIPLADFTHLSGRRVVGVAGSQIEVVPGLVPTLAVVRTKPNRYMPQPGPLAETLFTTSRGEFAVRRFANRGESP